MTTNNALSYYLENALLNHLLTNTPYTSASTIFLALYLTTPGKNDIGTEVSGGGYSASPCPTFAITGSGAYNSTEMRFGEATEDWGNINYMGLRGDGNLLFWGNLENVISPTVNQVVKTDPYISVNLSGNEDMGWGAGVSAALLDFILNDGSYSSGSCVYLAMGRSVIYNSSYNLTSWTEVSAADYSRQLISASSWSAVTFGITDIQHEILFTESAQANWGIISHMVLYDQETNGSPIMWGKLADSYIVSVGDGVKFPSDYIWVSAHLSVPGFRSEE